MSPVRYTNGYCAAEIPLRRHQRAGDCLLIITMYSDWEVEKMSEIIGAVASIGKSD